ncbi:MAG: hypothetical protein ACQKBY_00040, partial [Verrucomicrobiales bacterium]
MKLLPKGAVICGAAAALVVFGLLETNGVLLSLGLAGFLLLGVAWFLAWGNLRGLRVDVAMPERVFANEGFDLALRVENGRRVRDAFGVRAELRLCGVADLRTEALWVPAR